ncbi:MAG: ATP-binding protein [Alteromonadales bacterium]|nr:ATP-binding protein [Alteromonadales bacterium]
MLLTYSIENYKGFKNKQIFSFIASAGDEFPGQLYTLPNGNKVNRVGCVIGPNGAGKTHLFESIEVLTLALQMQKLDDIYHPFLLDDSSNSKPTCFEVLLYNPKDERLYRYNLKIKKDEVIEEQLHTRTLKKSAREKKIFTRDSNGVDFNREFSSAEKLTSILKNNSTVIGFASAISNAELDFVREWADGNLLFKADYDSIPALRYIEDWLGDISDENVKKFTDIFSRTSRELSLKIDKIQFETVKDEKKLVFYHTSQNKKGSVRVESDDAFTFFSRGSLNLISFIAFYWAAVVDGRTLYIDEFDGTIHYKIACKVLLLIKKVTSNQDNYKGQIIFSTHNIHLLDENFRRDEIHIVQKDKNLSSIITRVCNFSVRKDSKISNKYFNDEFGGLPECISKKQDA